VPKDLAYRNYSKDTDTEAYSQTDSLCKSKYVVVK